MRYVIASGQSDSFLHRTVGFEVPTFHHFHHFGTSVDYTTVTADWSSWGSRLQWGRQTPFFSTWFDSKAAFLLGTRAKVQDHLLYLLHDILVRGSQFINSRIFVISSLLNTSISLVRFDNPIGVVCPETVARIQIISIYFDTFCEPYDRQHASVVLSIGRGR